MLAWWRRRQRQKILEAPFPDTWRRILRQNVGYLRRLDDTEIEQLERLIRVFVAEKRFVGCGGLELDDEIRVTIAANACILLLGLDHDLYRRVESILVYPSTVVPPDQEGDLVMPSGELVGERGPLLGEAHFRGPVILVWDAVAHDSRHPRQGHNVVYHEFAHKLDMLDDVIDGTPPLRGSEQYRQWAEVCGQAYLELRRRVEAGEPTFLDPYAATSEAEFFAVATEVFFEKPWRLEEEHPDLYDVLRQFYRQDPGGRLPPEARDGGRA